MQCSVCGSQDTKLVQGISKKTGRPWKAYECLEPACKNESGYPNRTFVPIARQTAPNAKFGASKSLVSNPLSTLEAKVDKILAILRANFPDKSVQIDPNEELQVESEDSPF